MAKEKNIKIDTSGFEKEFEKHQHLSKTSSAGMFQGGLADKGEKTMRYHTATHLLHQALKIVLGENVAQKGSNITSERLRFDFAYPEKMTKEQIKKTEEIVNGKNQRKSAGVLARDGFGGSQIIRSYRLVWTQI